MCFAAAGLGRASSTAAASGAGAPASGAASAAGNASWTYGWRDPGVAMTYSGVPSAAWSPLATTAAGGVAACRRSTGATAGLP